MSTDYRPQSEISDAEFREVILPGGRELASLSDIQYIYGQMLELGAESTPYSAPDEYAPFLTPMEASAVRGREQGIVYFNVQLNREEKSLRPLGATILTGSEEHIDRCAFSHYDAANGVDHSITQKTSKNGGIDPDKSTYKDFSYIAENKLRSVINGWPTQDLIQPVIEEHEDGWIIQQINELSTFEEEMESIRGEIEDTLTVDDTKRVTRLVSIRFFESDLTAPIEDLDLPGQRNPDEWVYPANLEVLLEGMKAQRTGKWRTKNKANASGTAAGYVHSDIVDDVYGMGTAPLSLYTGKKRAWMPNLNRDLSAAIHPFTAETLAMIGKSTPLLNACRQSAGLSIYHFPYFGGEQTPQKMRYLYELLWETHALRQQEEDEDDENTPSHTPIERFYKQLTQKAASDDAQQSVIDSFQFWTVSIINVQSGRKRAIAEIKGTNALRTVDVAQQAESVARDLSNTSLFETYEWDFTTPETDFHAQITSPYYFISTTVTTTDEDDVDQNEPGYALFQQLLRDQPLSVSQLLNAYIPHIESCYDAGADDGRRVPKLQIIQQFAQLATLSRSGLLDVDIPEVANIDEPYQIPVEGDGEPREVDMTETADDTNPDHDDEGGDSTTTTAKERAIAEQEAYKRMVTEQPVLSESPSRRAVFTLGSLITTVSGYQAAKGTKPLNARLNPTTITKHNIQQYVTDVLEQINTYAGAESGNNIWKYETQTGQLTEDLTAMPVSEWELSSADIQYHLSLGMAFGAQRHD
ncbi:hypothetical protein EKH57_17380 (plasmid) [Halorubrum sp. BOL3-1]|uniref:TM1802 family CRISPR-associated protein n=1 Tax=Halorubrum sp. BOL3-1 TaxID=2497325 RepID=UPI001004DA96|nr:TM1802 family CRISPR-associated protein [Halorubrum sp. BOL3-1]QAU14458.1 hypothetical protein EKH57_17380 [Halorubrum sp. BOL3-1]